MIIFYNQTDVGFLHQSPNDALSKIIRVDKVNVGARTIKRQCFLLVKDKNISDKKNISSMVSMNAPVIISDSEHGLTFGNRDLNPIIWAKDDKSPNRDIYVLSLINKTNRHFQILSSSDSYYMLEYSVTNEAITLIIAHNDTTEPLRFELIDIDNNTSDRYTMFVSNGKARFQRQKFYMDEPSNLNTVAPLKKFRPARPTEFILTDMEVIDVVDDKRISPTFHHIITVTNESVEEVIEYVKQQNINAITFYGNSTEENAEIREKISNNFRIYYEMNKFKLNKIKIR